VILEGLWRGEARRERRRLGAIPQERVIPGSSSSSSSSSGGGGGGGGSSSNK